MRAAHPLAFDAHARYAALALAILNRETGALLAALWVLWHWGDRREVRYGLVLMTAAVIEYMLIRRVMGELGHHYTLPNMWGVMWREWGTEIALYNVLIAPLWIAAAVRWRCADARLQRLALGAVAVSVAAFGMWHEIRLQFAAFVLLIPVIFGDRKLHIEAK